MLTSEELAAIRGRSEAAANGEWEFDHGTEFITRLTQKDGNTHEIIAILDTYTDEDATFIAHARTDVPALLDTIADARTGLGKHFDDIDRDCEGNPNDLDWMIELAGGQLSSAISHRERETERANIAEHKVSQLRSRFALELAARTTPDMERQAARIIELEDINGGLRAWQDVARPKLEARMDKAEARVKELESAQQPRLIDEAPQDGSEVLAWSRHVGWNVLSWSHVSDCWVGHGREYPTHWVYLPSPVDDTYSRGATP